MIHGEVKCTHSVILPQTISVWFVDERTSRNYVGLVHSFFVSRAKRFVMFHINFHCYKRTGIHHLEVHYNLFTYYSHPAWLFNIKLTEGTAFKHMLILPSI